MLTDNEISIIKGYKKTYADFGVQANMHKEIFTPPFAPNDQQLATIQAIQGGAITPGSLPFNSLNPQDFVKLSDTATITEVSLPNGTAVTVTMTLIVKSAGFVLAVPRVSVYDGDVALANEINQISNAWREVNISRSWAATRGVGGSEATKHILKVSTANVSGVTKRFNFRGDWFFIGTLVGAAT